MSKRGLPVDPNEWTIEDWQDLFATVEEFKARLAARHRPRCDRCREDNPDGCDPRCGCPCHGR